MLCDKLNCVIAFIYLLSLNSCLKSREEVREKSKSKAWPYVFPMCFEATHPSAEGGSGLFLLTAIVSSFSVFSSNS